MIETVRVTCVNTNTSKDVKIGSSLEELIDPFGVESHLFVNAKVNNRPNPAYRVYRPKTVEFVDLS